MDCSALVTPVVLWFSAKFSVASKWNDWKTWGKVKEIYSLDSIPSPSPSVKIQIIGGKVGLKCKGKTWLAIVNIFFCTKSLLTTPSWPPKNKNKKFKCSQLLEGDGIESRLPFKIFSTLFSLTFSKVFSTTEYLADKQNCQAEFYFI